MEFQEERANLGKERKMGKVKLVKPELVTEDEGILSYGDEGEILIRKASADTHIVLFNATIFHDSLECHIPIIALEEMEDG